MGKYNVTLKLILAFFLYVYYLSFVQGLQDVFVIFAFSFQF